MKKMMKRFGALLLGAVIMLGSSMTVCATGTYTYNYDYWGDIQYSPDAYTVAGVFTSQELGLETGIFKPEGMYTLGDMIYLCDTGNNRIVEIKRVDVQKLEVVRIIEEFNGNGLTENTTFNAPTDVAISEEGEFFIADMNNGRILKLDKDLNYIMEFNKPVDANFSQDQVFLPKKITIDTAGRVYCIPECKGYFERYVHNGAGRR